jgi:hypothetical protein
MFQLKSTVAAIHDNALARIKSGAELTFPEYQPKTTRLERLLRLNTKHHRALAQVIPLVQQSAAHDYDRALKLFAGNGDADYRLDRAEGDEKLTYGEYTSLLPILDGLETETLVFIAETYNGTVTSRYPDLITSALPPVYLKDVEASGEDINLIVKNVISYRKNIVSWNRMGISAFNDVRLAAPELNRPDLYNLTGEDREWVSRIIKVSSHSQYITEIHHNEEDPAGSPSHMNPELASLLREGDEWVYRARDIISQRKLRADEITPELVRGIHSTGAAVLNTGML